MLYNYRSSWLGQGVRFDGGISRRVHACMLGGRMLQLKIYRPRSGISGMGDPISVTTPNADDAANPTVRH